jgi:site-specific DNA-methyltransferase (adenine-specific)
MKTNVIYNEDCLEGMKRIPDNSIDLTVTSPPYDDLRDYEGYEWDFKPLAKQLYRVTKDGGMVVWVIGDETKDFCETLSSFKQAIYFVEDMEFKLLDTMIYKKKAGPSPYPNLKRYAPWFEYMFVFSKGKPKTFNPIKDKLTKSGKGEMNSGSTARQKDGKTIKTGSYQTSKYKIRCNVWGYDVGKNKTTKDKFAYEHPAMFPEQLAKDHIKSWSNEGDVVLDPFCGAGTTLKQAEILDREWIGIDISQEYVNLSYKRVGKVNKKYYKELPEEEKPNQTRLF